MATFWGRAHRRAALQTSQETTLPVSCSLRRIGEHRAGPLLTTRATETDAGALVQYVEEVEGTQSRQNGTLEHGAVTDRVSTPLFMLLNPFSGKVFCLLNLRAGHFLPKFIP